MNRNSCSISDESSSVNISAYCCLVFSSFVCAFSLPGGRLFLAVSLLLLCIDFIKSRKIPSLPRTAWIGFLFMFMLVVSTVRSDAFVFSGTKLMKLLWFAGMPVTALLVTSRWRFMGVLGGYAAGAGVLALKNCYDSVSLCLKAGDQVRAGLIDYKTVLINNGSITDGQRFMVGIIAVTGLIFICRANRRGLFFWLVVLAMEISGLVLTFKRGSLICTALLVGVFVVLRTNWKYLFLFIALVTAIAFLPPVQMRLAGLQDEFNTGSGGRMLMWKKIAPELVKARPWLGMGYRMLTNEEMVKIAPNVERNRDHLHSNPVQMIVDGGVIGLLLYFAWMISGIADAAIFLVRSRMSTTSMMTGFMYFGLLLNGIVEYNFGDAEIVLLYGLVMGCCIAGAAILSDRSSGQLEGFDRGR